MLALALLLLTNCQPATDEDDNDRGESAETSTPLMALTYHIEKETEEGPLVVALDTPFLTGEGFRLSVTAHSDGVLYLFNRSADGTVQRLFPDPRINRGENSVESNDTVVIPGGESGGWFRFDETAGNEIVYILFAPEPIEALDSFTADSIGAGVFESTLEEIQERQEGLALRRAVRDNHVLLELEGEDEDAILIGTLAFIHQP